MRLFGWLAIATLIACTGGKDDPKDDADADTDADADADACFDYPSTEDLLKKFQGRASDCEGVQFYDDTVVGIGVFYGLWEKKTDDEGNLEATGREYLVMYANPYWESGCNGGCETAAFPPGEDCVIALNSGGSEKKDNGNCLDCDYALDISADVVEAETTCFDGIWDPSKGGDADFSTWKVQYQIAEGSGGKSAVHHESGTLLGEGMHSDCQLTYEAEETACWFF